MMRVIKRAVTVLPVPGLVLSLLNFVSLNFVSLDFVSLNFVSLYFVSLNFVSLNFVTLSFVSPELVFSCYSYPIAVLDFNWKVL